MTRWFDYFSVVLFSSKFAEVDYLGMRCTTACSLRMGLCRRRLRSRSVSGDAVGSSEKARQQLETFDSIQSHETGRPCVCSWCCCMLCFRLCRISCMNNHDEDHDSIAAVMRKVYQQMVEDKKQVLLTFTAESKVVLSNVWNHFLLDGERCKLSFIL